MTMTPEIFYTLSPGDRQLYFGGAFVRTRVNSRPYEWTLVREFGGDIVRLGFADGTEANHSVKKVDWDFSIPETGVYNYKNMVVHFTRKPVRGSSKAITPNNSYFNNILSPLVESNVIPRDFFQANSFSLNVKSINLLFSDESPPSFEKGMAKILKKQSLAYALDNRISLSQGILSSRPTIWLKDLVIGELDATKGIVIPLHPQFIPELQLSFGPQGIIVQN